MAAQTAFVHLCLPVPGREYVPVRRLQTGALGGALNGRALRYNRRTELAQDVLRKR